MTAKQRQQIIGRCPVCNDEQMAFACEGDGQVQCGGCASIVKRSEVAQDS
jgi:hypothetical protein